MMTTTHARKPIRAYHGDPAIKRRYLERVEAHRAADEMCLELVSRGLIRVDAENGKAYAIRFANKELGTSNSKGYRVCTLHLDGERRQIKVHRLVWVSVNGVVPESMVIDHVNRIKSDNRIANLRLVTHAGNAVNRRSYDGVSNPSAKIDKAIADAMRTENSAGMSYGKLAKKYGVSKSLVAAIIRKEAWT